MNYVSDESANEHVPMAFQNVVSQLMTQYNVDTIQTYLMFIFIVVILTENGFLLLNAQQEPIDFYNTHASEIMRQCRTQSGYFEVKLILKDIPNIPLKFTVSPVGATVLLNLIIEGLSSETYSTCLPITRYIVFSQDSSVPIMFQDLQHLTMTLKNNLFSAVKSTLLSHYGFASPSLKGLPEEIIYEIIEYLPITDIINLGKTCNRLNSILNKEDTWHKLCKRDYDITQSSSSTSWKQLYKEKYAQQVEEKLKRDQQRTAGVMHDYMDYSDFVSYIDNPMWGAIL